MKKFKNVRSTYSDGLKDREIRIVFHGRDLVGFGRIVLNETTMGRCDLDDEVSEGMDEIFDGWCSIGEDEDGETYAFVETYKTLSGDPAPLVWMRAVEVLS